MTIQKYPQIPNITRPVLAQDPIIETTYDFSKYYESNIYMPSSQAWSKVIYKNNIFLTHSDYADQSVYATSTDGISWTTRNFPLTTRWADIAYGNGSFVAITQDFAPNPGLSYSATSTDGITWTTRNLPLNLDWRSIEYGNGSFVVIGNDTSIVITSTNGITWTQRSLPISSIWTETHYGNNIFIALSADYNVPRSYYVKSTDGITWTQSDLPHSFEWSHISSRPNLFIAIPFTTTSIYVTSTDGTTWTTRNFPLTYAWSFVESGRNNFIVTTAQGNNSIALFSGDGINWTISNFEKPGNYRSIAYGDNKFVATPNSIEYPPNGFGPGSIFAYSEDGLRWIGPTRYLPKINDKFYNFIEPGNYLIDSSSNSSVIISGAGISFLVTTSPTIINSTGGSIQVSPFNKGFIYRRGSTPSSLTVGWGVATEGLDKVWTTPFTTGTPISVAIYSTDGISWLSTNVPAANYPYGAYGNGSYVSISFGSSIAISSTNGITWTQRTLPASTNWNQVVFVDNNSNIPTGFYAIAGGGTSYAAYSPDSIVWNLRTLPANGSWKPLLYAQNKLLAINAAGSQVVESTNGTTWTTIGNMPFTPTSPTLWNSLAYNGSLYVVPYATSNPTTTSIYATSTNGITWTQRNMPAALVWSRTEYGAGTFVTGPGVFTSIYASSQDGLTWSLRNIDFDAAGGAGIRYINRFNAFLSSNGTTGTGQSYVTSISSPLPDGQVVFGMYKV